MNCSTERSYAASFPACSETCLIDLKLKYVVRKKVKAKPFSSGVDTHLQGQRFAFETMIKY